MSPAYLKRIRSRRLAATGVDTRTIGKKEGSAEYDSLLFIAAEVAWGTLLSLSLSLSLSLRLRASRGVLSRILGVLVRHISGYAGLSTVQ